MDTRKSLLCACALLASAIPLCLPADTILDDFQVNTEFPGHPPQDSPYSVANWQTQRIYTAFLSKHDGANWDVALARHNYNLQPIGQTTYLNVREGTYNCLRPKLVIRSTGVGAAWIEARSPNRIMFRSLDGNGNPTCPPVRIEDDFSNVLRDSLSIAALYDGFLLVWYDLRDSSKIWAQKVNLSGQLIGPNFPIQPDSSGSILGLEAQNHPDGRVLVSWVTNGQYSRGRWLDSLGNFMGEVFEMAEAWTDDLILKSLVRFELGGTGLIYQYSSEYIGWPIQRFVYATYTDENGLQSGAPSPISVWWEYFDEMSYGYSLIYYFPDVAFLPDENFVKVSTFTLWYEEGPGGGSSFRLFSTEADSEVVLWGLGTSSGYDLCLLSPNALLVSYDPTELILRKYQIADLGASDLQWISEPNFGASQNASDICVHQTGEFRIIYNNWIGSTPYVYTRFLSSSGLPVVDDMLISMDSSFNPIMVEQGRMAKSGDEQVVVIWQNAGKINATDFSSSIWSNSIENFGCSPIANFDIPNVDINYTNHLLLVWIYQYFDWGSGFYSSLGYLQPFVQLFTSNYPPGLINPGFGAPGESVGLDVALRDDGRFLICWRSEEGWTAYRILTKAGINYHEITASSTSPENSGYCSRPVVCKSLNGFWIAWVGDDQSVWPFEHRVRIWQFDADGNPTGMPLAVDEEDAEPIAGMGYPPLATVNLAVSSSSNNFAVCWQDARNDSGDIYCRQFNPDGSFFGNEYRVNSDPVGVMQKEPAIAFGPEDRLYFTWTDFRNPGGQGDIYCKVIEWEDALDAPVYQPPLPKAFALYPPSPNPFNAVTALSFQLPVPSHVKLEVFDLAGRRVGAHSSAPLFEGPLEAGLHKVLFDGSDLASGIYIARLQAGKFTGMQKLVLLK